MDVPCTATLVRGQHDTDDTWHGAGDGVGDTGGPGIAVSGQLDNATMHRDPRGRCFSRRTPGGPSEVPQVPTPFRAGPSALASSGFSGEAWAVRGRSWRSPVGLTPGNVCAPGSDVSVGDSRQVHDVPVDGAEIDA
jgi:hypothetical protein